MSDKVIGLMLSIGVGLIMIGLVLVPIVSSAQEVMEPITVYNEGMGHTYREAKSGDVLKLESRYDASTQKKTDIWTLNDKVVINDDLTSYFEWDILMMSDVLWAQVNSTANASSGSIVLFNQGDGTNRIYYGSSSTVPEMIWTVSFTDDTISWTATSGGTLVEEYSINYGWCFVPCAIEDGGYRSSSVDASNFKMTDINDYVLSGSYTTGELDTGYWYKDGVMFTSVTTYSGSTSTTSELIDGTYDIYNVSATVTITDGTTSETFAPYRALVPYEVHGHADHGAALDLVGIAPLLVLVVLVLSAVAIIFRNRI